MSKQHANITILAEDAAQANFMRHFLKKRGYNHRKLRFKTAPMGLGSGFAYVLDNYLFELKAYRRQAKHLSLALIVMIDADMRDVEEVKKLFEKRCHDLELEFHSKEERIMILIPKRNIETWVVYFQGENVKIE